MNKHQGSVGAFFHTLFRNDSKQPQRIVVFSALSLMLTLGTAFNNNLIPAAFAANTLTVNGYALDGKALGMWLVIQQNGATVKSGFTPLTFAGITGASYSLQAHDYAKGSIFFDHWEDGSTTRTRTLTLNSDVTVTSYYKAPPPPNRAPTATNDTAIMNQDTSVTIDVLANDSDLDGNLLSVTSATGQSHGSASINMNNTITYTPAPRFSGQDSFAYTISDGRGGSATATTSVQVNFVNSLPTASSQNTITNEDVPLPITLDAADEDADILSFLIETSPTHGTLSGPIDSLVYTPFANYAGQDSFTFKANDGAADSNLASISITVAPVNDSPVANNDSIATNQDVPVTASVLSNDSDVDNDLLKVTSITMAPGHGSAKINSDETTITYTPSAGFSGTDSFTYTTSDGNGGTAIALATIAVKFVPSTYLLTVNSQDMYGKTTGGLYTVVSKGGATVKTGFTSLSYTGTTGATYSVSVSDYGSMVFDHWENGSTVRARTVTLNADTAITAHFRVPTVALNPASGVSGITIAATGTYYTPNSAVTVTYDGRNVASATTNSAGAFAASFVVPALGTGFHTVQAVDGKAWKASAKFEDTTPPPDHPLKTTILPKTGVYVALYMYPTGNGAAEWQKVIDEKTKHPSVPIVATFNPNSGPGSAKDTNIANWVAKLKAAGVIAIGYTYDDYGTRSISALKADADKYKNWYNADGLFIDEFTNKVGFEDHYRDITAYVKSTGMKMTMGNPGTDVPRSYIGTVDVINIAEGRGYNPISWLQYCVGCSADQGWHYQNDKRHFSYMRYDVSALDAEFETESAKWVGLLLITNGNDSNGRWFALPPYFGTMVATLDK